jgi:NAD(P)-dependent dehydrogenase (short-subunit alcohol dehydrogenase family)
MGRLDGKVTWITGAAGGIGQEICRRFLAEGATVVASDLDCRGLDALARESGGRLVTVAGDAAEEADVARAVAVALERFGRLDGAVLNAGIEGKIVPLTEFPVENFDLVVRVNLRGVFLGLKHAMRGMQATGGSIVALSSTAGIGGSRRAAGYVASKHGVVGLMRTAALEGAERGIRVNTVNPAPIATRMIRSIEEQVAAGTGDDYDEVHQRMISMIPLGRFGTPAEAAALILFLVSDEASFCTGGVYMIDGGRSCGR